ncbi:AAA family ATPase [Caulifigura coniformis]|nr:MoxR family ATPase [Caulifigura coniformis]
MVQELPNTLAARDQSLAESHAAIARLSDRLNRVLKGKPGVVESVIICLLARGHLLLEDRPGLGKTTLAKGLAAGVGGRYARIQCTPDLLPGDITGFSLFNQQEQQFEFRPGPVFSDVLLADEINRATPRTQSVLLEAMAERQVTVDAICHELSATFFVIATQNPFDQHGTYPLPEAQLDRFAMKLSVGYPDRLDEMQMLTDAIGASLTSEANSLACFARGQLQRIQQLVADVFVDARIQHYLLDLIQATRSHSGVVLGASPRAALTWQRVAQARAFFHGREYVVPDDVQETAQPVLSVRLGVVHENTEQVIQELVGRTPLPAYSAKRQP